MLMLFRANGIQELLLSESHCHVHLRFGFKGISRLFIVKSPLADFLPFIENSVLKRPKTKQRTQCNAKCKQIFAWWKGLAGQHLAGLRFYLSFQGLIQSDSIGLLNKNNSG